MKKLMMSQYSKEAFCVLLCALLLFLCGCGATKEPQGTVSAPMCQTFDGYTMELQSAVAEGYTTCVTFALTAPENVDLSGVLDLRTEERLSFRQLTATPEGSSMPANLSYHVCDDGDGENNTLCVVLDITPILAQGQEASGKTCRISFREIVLWGYDHAYEEELRAGKYAGQAGFFLTPEESDRVHPQTVLASGTWEFEATPVQAEIHEAELLPKPILTKAQVIRTGANEYEPVETIEDVTLTSIRLTSSGITVDFQKPLPTETFEGLYLDIAGREYGDICLMMKNGTKIVLFQPESAKETALLTTDSFVDLQQVDHLQLCDGTQITVQ